MKILNIILLLGLFLPACKKVEYHNIDYEITTDIGEEVVLISGKRPGDNSIAQGRIDTVYNGNLSTVYEVPIGWYAHTQIKNPNNLDSVNYEITIKDETTNKVLGSKTVLLHNEMEDWESVYEVLVKE